MGRQVASSSKEKRVGFASMGSLQEKEGTASFWRRGCEILLNEIGGLFL